MEKDNSKAKKQEKHDIETKNVESRPQAETRKKIVAKDIDVHQYISVKNGFHGRLVYVSKKTGEEFHWAEFGDEQDMELSELKNVKNTNKKFFTNNWFMFDEPWVVEYLGVAQYYKHALTMADFDDLFALSPAEIEDRLSGVSPGQKRSLVYRAKEKIDNQEIYDLRVISTLEKCLGVELIER